MSDPINRAIEQSRSTTSAQSFPAPTRALEAPLNTRVIVTAEPHLGSVAEQRSGLSVLESDMPRNRAVEL